MSRHVLVLVGALIGIPAMPVGGAETSPVQYVNWSRLRLPCTFQTEGTAPIVGLALWWTADGGNSWRRVPESGTIAPSKVVDFEAPEDGSYGFWLQAFDEVGQSSAAPLTGDEPTLRVVVDTMVPAIEVVSPLENRGCYAGQVIELSWAVHDANLAEQPLRIFYLPGDENTPIPLEGRVASYPARGTTLWPLPLADDRVSFLFVAHDLAGNRCEERRGPFEIKDFSARLGPKAVVVEALSRRRLVPVFYRFADLDPAAMGSVELHWHAADHVRGETEWRLGSTDDDTSSPILFAAPRDGLFAIKLAVRAKEGGAYVRPVGDRADADAVTLVDTHDPQVEILAVNGVARGDVWLEGGGRLEVELVVTEPHLPARAVALEYSLDREQSWRVLADELDVVAERPFRFSWTLPHITAEGFLLRARATDRVGRTGYGAFAGKIQIRDSGSPIEVDAATLVRRGRLHLSQGTNQDVREAISILKTALGFDPANAEAHVSLAHALVLGGARGEALMHLRRAVECVPGEPAYRLDLVEQLLAEAKERRDETCVAEARAQLAQVSLDELFVRSDFALLREKYRAAGLALVEVGRGLAERLEEER